MDINLKTVAPFAIKIYTKRGSYQGHEKNALAWELVCTTQVNGMGLGMPTKIPTSDFSTVRINEFDIQAFYVTTIKRRGGIRYGSANSKSVSESDANIEIMMGSGLQYPFGYGLSSTVFKQREFNGSIKYSIPSAVAAASTEKMEKELLTTFSGENGSFGIM